jgi:hypothetical protein
VPVVAQTCADEVGKIVEKYIPADQPPTAEGFATLQGALVTGLNAAGTTVGASALDA